MKMLIYAVAIMVGLVAAVSLGFALSPSGEEAPFSLHGWIAIALGIVGTAVVGIGLMALVFLSHRNGHDERVGKDPPPRP
ncbi:MAG: hypothetical protein EAZ99_16130 [Alphaproteobacteria bacterium]|nr:hypothetical protein [Alphaproteobacteria bacterium]TAD87847.1 MAG: hypothetical protein EAZ99_16130 [Alphaproteobacteria bacterium]